MIPFGKLLNFLKMETKVITYMADWQISPESIVIVKSGFFSGGQEVGPKVGAKIIDARGKFSEKSEKYASMGALPQNPHGQ